MPSSIPLLQIRDLSISFKTRHGRLHAVRSVTLDIHRGKSVGIVGESGCGKSSLALGIVRLLDPRATSVSGQLFFDGIDLLRLSAARMRDIRGNEIGMVFQDPMTSLNPYLTVGAQVAEPPRYHRELSQDVARAHSIALLEALGIRDAAARFDQYPHQFSGGMRQRTMLATALSCTPRLIIADEPTTALDVTTQADVLRLMRRTIAKDNISLLLITHDLAIVADTCDFVAVMYAGEIVEYGVAADVIAAPTHPYTRALLNAAPHVRRSRRGPLTAIRGNPPSLLNYSAVGCAFAPRCARAQTRCQAETPALEPTADGRPCRCFYPHDSNTAGQTPAPADLPMESPDSPQPQEVLLSIRGLTVHYPMRMGHWMFSPPITRLAVSDVSFELYEREILGLVGESGCGKSTIARAVACLQKPSGGEIRFAGTRIDDLRADRLRAMRPKIQLIFQDPYASLNPRLQAGAIIAEPLRNFGLCERRELPAKAAAMMELVGLDPSWARRYPHEFSGGQRQRIGIARALICRPQLLICDEPVSSLDVSIQAQILELLHRLHRELGLSMLFISHDLAVVRHVAHRVAVMVKGKIVECGKTEEIYERPTAEYTKSLLRSLPGAKPAA